MFSLDGSNYLDPRSGGDTGSIDRGGVWHSSHTGAHLFSGPQQEKRGNMCNKINGYVAIEREVELASRQGNSKHLALTFKKKALRFEWGKEKLYIWK